MKWIARVLAMVALAAVPTGCGHPAAPTEKPAPAPAVHAPVAAVEKQSIESSYDAVGTVRAKVASIIQSKMMGHVKSVNVREGDRVQTGQVLIEIDSREAEAQVLRAQNAVREAREMRLETEKAVEAALQSKAAAEAGNELAAATFNRYKGLASNQAVSRQIYDEADAKLKSAAAEAARANEMALSAQAKRGEIDARIEQAKAELTNAQTMLSFAKITAPFAGIVTRKTVDIGDLAAPGSPLLEMEDTGQYRLEALVDEEHVGRIALGDKAAIALDALGDKGLEGVVSELVPSADPSSRTFTVKIDLPQDAALKSGMFGRARFGGAPKQVLLIPQSAIVQRGQLNGVYVVGADDIARLRLITLGKPRGAQVEVLSGLDPGERIVTDKTGDVTDGAPVRQG